MHGTVEVNVDERENTGTFLARLGLPEGELVIELDRLGVSSEVRVRLDPLFRIDK